MASLPTIPLNKETIALFMGVVGVITTLVGAYNWLLSGRAENSPVVTELVQKNHEQDQRLDRTDEDRANNTAALKDQTSETQKLKEAVVKLTTVLETNNPTKKAEFYFENSPTRPAIQTLEVRR
jgi:hypothetical protein